MRRCIWLFTIQLLIISIFYSYEMSQAQTDSGRLVKTINNGWEFTYRGNQKESPSIIAKLDSSHWKAVRIPHTWNKEDAFDEEPGYKRGIGWYKKELNVSSDPQKVNYLHFEGVNQITDVYVNGKHVKQHIGGYTAFTANISRYINNGKKNYLLVRVDNRHNPDVPPLNADFTFYGGIYRDVELWSLNRIHFGVDTEYGSSGIKVEFPKVTDDQGIASVNAEVTNNRSDETDGKIKARLYRPDGALMEEKSIEVSLGSSTSEPVEFSFNVSDPELWGPENPEQYLVKLELYESGELIDALETNFGFRYFSFDPDKGLILNGKITPLRGTNRHQDYAGRGNALPDSYHRRDMEIINEMGANYVRLAHYPQEADVLNAADRLGLLVWEEIPIVNYITESEAFTKHSKKMLREMIRQHYNHPSILLWGYMNEILLFNEKGEFGETEDSTYIRHLRRFTKDLEQIAQNEDPSRYTAMAMHYSDIYNRTGLAGIADVVGWNLYFGWYYNEFSDLGKFLDRQHKEFPDRVVTISEYGAGSDLRIHTQKPKSFDFSNEYQNRLHESYLKQIQERDYLAGSAIWNQFDFGSQSRGDSRPHINQKGVMTYERQPKDAYYHYKSHWSEEPVLHINSGSWDKMVTGSRSKEDTLVIYTNVKSVKLEHNGRSLGSKSPNGQNIIKWPVTLELGENNFLALSESDKGLKASARDIELVSADVKENNGSLNVNMGNSFQFIDESEQLWIPDDLSAGGLWDLKGGQANSVSSEIMLTNREPLYQYFREGITRFRTALSKGKYEVRLHFIEPNYRKPGKRIFDVSINGAAVAQNLDLAKEAGYQTAYSLETEVSVQKEGRLQVNFEKVEGEPIISGIQLRKLDE